MKQTSFTTMSEHRLCRFAGPDKLGEAAELAKQESNFKAQMVELGKSLPRTVPEPVDVSQLLDDVNWRAAWENPATFSGLQAVVDVEDPETLLRNFPPEKRKEFFIQYLQENFPQTAIDTNPRFAEILAASPADLATDPVRRHVLGFIEMGRAMQNQPVMNIAGTSFADETELRATVSNELTMRYVDPATGALSPKAFPDFTKTMRTHPSFGPGVSSNPDALKTALSGEKTTFAAAVQSDVFSPEQLEALTSEHQAMVDEKQEPIRASSEAQRKVRTKIEEAEGRSIVEKLKSNFSDLEPWQKLAVLGAGVYLAYRAFFKRENRTGFDNFILFPGMGVLGFYLLGGRDVIRGTILDDGLKKVEGLVNKGVKKVRGTVSDRPEVSEEQLETYATYFKEIAQEDLNGELEAMGYISNVPLGSIAESFSMSSDARGGALDLSTNAPLKKSLEKLYKSSGQLSAVMNKLRMYNVSLGDGMTHVFYMLGASEQPTEHRKLEELRDGRAYDDLPDGSVERDIYRRLSEKGLLLAKTEYKDKSWFEVVETFLNK